jgi:hypothetical protein
VTYATVNATYATYQALTSSGKTYDQLVYDYPAGTTGPVTPWPPRDV